MAAKKTASPHLMALEPIAFDDKDGKAVIIARGEVLPADSPLVAGHEMYFGEFSVVVNGRRVPAQVADGVVVVG
jgi:hypothetical protein